MGRAHVGLPFGNRPTRLSPSCPGVPMNHQPVYDLPPLVPVSRLTASPLEWLWPGRLALGKLSMLDGDPGLGKSLLSLDLCARLSTGRPWPDGSPGPGPAPAIVLNGEDGPADTVRPRLEALGADLDRVFVVETNQPGAAGPVRLPTHLSWLDDMLSLTGARLLVIDPIMAYLGPDVVAGCDQSVRAALFPLALLAERHRCTILFIRHLLKHGSGPSLYRGLGTIGFLAACRSGWLAARDPHDPDRRVLAQVKNNLAGPQPSLAFAVHPAHGGGPLEWLGTSPLSADQLLLPAAPEPVAHPCDRARSFLEELLRHGPRTTHEVWGAGRELGLSERTLQRAMRELEIRSVPVYADGKRVCYWLLPGQQLPADVPAAARLQDLEDLLGPLREKYPPLPPLDEM